MSSSNDFEDLRSDEELLSDDDELLWRQVHPQFIQDGRLTSQAFRPTEKDDGELSVTRAAVVSAGEAYRFYVEELGLESSGSWAVSVDDVHRAGLRAIDDHLAPTRPDPCPEGHVYIDFRHLSSQGKAAVKRSASRLRDAAEARKCQYPMSNYAGPAE